jgi:uncharacterized membrane protein
MTYAIAAVGFYDWMLALHLLSAFSVAAALVLYGVLVFSGRRSSASLEHARLLFRIAPVATPLIAAGTVLVLIFGVILAIDPDQFEIWDGWVIAGIVLWGLLGAVGRRTGSSCAWARNGRTRGRVGTTSRTSSSRRGSGSDISRRTSAGSFF